MAQIFKPRLQGGRFEELQIGGAAALRNMSIQSDAQITAMKENRQRQSQLDANYARDLRTVAENQRQNREINQKLEEKKDKLRYEATQLKGKRDVEALEAQAKEKLKRSEFLAKLSPTLAKNLGSAAEGIYKFIDIQKGVNRFKELEATGGFDFLDELHQEMEKQTNFPELQKQRNENIYNLSDPGSGDNADYLGSLFRNNGYYGSLLIADKVKTSLPAILASFDQYLQEEEIRLDPSQIQDALEFRAQEILAKYGIDEFSPAGRSILKMFSEEGAKRQQVATDGQTYLIYEENLKEDKEIHRVRNSQESWDQMIATVMNGFSKDTFGRVTSNRGVIGPKEAAISIWEEALKDPKYGGAGGWQRFVDDWGKWETPISPGHTKRMPWVLKNPKLFEVGGDLHKLWRTHTDFVVEENKKTLKDDDNQRLNNAITAYNNGDYEGPNKYQTLAAEYIRNEGNPETQKFLADRMLITQTDNNAGLVKLVMNAVSQGDTQEFFNLLALHPKEVENIVGAAPFAQNVKALVAAKGVDFDGEIDAFAVKIVKDIDATAFVTVGTKSQQANDVKNATKNLFYNLFNNTYKHIEDPIERYNKAKGDIENLAAIDAVNPDGTIGKGIFRRLDGTTKNGSVTFTAFYDGTLPGERITFKEIKEEIEESKGVGLLAQKMNQIFRDNKIDGKVIVSDTELTKVAAQLRSGSDSITLPENVRLLEQFYPSFDARKYINNLLRNNKIMKSELVDLQEGEQDVVIGGYADENLYIPPDAYQAFRKPGSSLKQEQKLPYLMSLYGPWSDEVGKHSTMSNFARVYSDGYTGTLQLGSRLLDMPQLEDVNYFPTGEDAKKLIQFGSEFNIHYLPYGSGGWFEP